MTIAKRCLVAGRVQGVFYRATTQQKARELGVRGFAKNLADGRVEVLAVGEPAQVAKLVDWLWEGSATSHVTQVEIAAVALEELDSLPTTFSTR